MKDRRIVRVNERGLRIGEDHQNARLTDAEVELMRRMHEVEGIGYRRLVKMFEVSKSVVRRICNYEIRAQSVADVRKVG